MSSKELIQKNAPSSETSLEVWIPKIIPALKSVWADYLFEAPANQPSPDFSDWLALIHAAATTPDDLPRHLTQLLKISKSETKSSSDWVILTDLLALTFEAAKNESAQLTDANWQSLVEIQNRVLKAAAQVSDHKKTPLITPSSLTKQALYLQIVTNIDKKVATVTNPNKLLNEIVALIQQTFGYEYVNLFLLNANKQTLMLQSAVWKTDQLQPKDFFTLPVKEGIVGRVAATGQGILVNNVSKSSNFVPHPALPKVKAQLSIPVQNDQDLFGVLDIESDQIDAFSKNDRQIVQALANHIAMVMTNARLQKTQQRYLREQTLIYNSIVTLGSGLDINSMLKSIGQKITEVVDAGACVVCRIDEKNKTITALSEYVLRHPGNPHHTWRPLNKAVDIAKDSIGQQVLRSKRPIINRAKPQNEHETLTWQVSPKRTNDKTRWNIVLALPFEIKMRVTGMIEIYDKSPNRTFSSEDVQICRILATQTALAVEQTRLFDETLHRLNEVSMLYAMAQKISSSLDLDGILKTIVTSLREAVDCRACCIFLLDESGQELEIKAADGLKPQWHQMAKLKVGQGAAGQAAAKSKTVYLSDTRKDPNFIVFDPGVQSLMVVPLIAQGKVIGTINVDDNHPDAFGQAQERLLTIAAAQAGAIIENARLFAKVSAEQQQMQAIMRYMADGLLLINKQGVIITCNPPLALMLGINYNEMIGKNIKSANLPPNLAAITTSATRHARTGVLANEVAIKTPRPRTLQVFTTHVVDDNKNPAGEVRVVHDVTKEKELEQLKQDFISTVSHELRTPLFSIQGFAQLMLEEDQLDPDTQSEFLSTIQRQAVQLSDMVNNLLDLSKFDEGKLNLEKKPLSLLDLIHQTILKLQGFAHKQNVNLISDLSVPLPTFTGDKHRLEQVLTNLIGNAIKFSNKEQDVVVDALATETEILVQVKDYGIGIPAEAMDNIFSRYYQVHDKNERSAMGSGLGLHIAKKVVEGHGGRIWAESEAGQGSTFCFTLPLSHR